MPVARAFLGWGESGRVGQNDCMTRDLGTVIPVWVVAVVGAVLIGIAVPKADYVQALQTVMAATVFVTFCIQLAVARQAGFVDRLVKSVGGSIVILAAATGVLAAIALSTG